MKNCFSNATVSWTEEEIIKRENFIREIPVLLLNQWRALNPAISMERIETPILTPAKYLQSHIEENFELINTGERGYLRPETTAGTIEVMNNKYQDNKQMMKNLPKCLWQVGCSFRDEAKPDTMRASKLRLVQFYQMEFQLFAKDGSMAPYIETAIQCLVDNYGGDIVVADELPHYSVKTLDWHINGLEIAGCSVRKDWEHGTIFEVAIGLDRLVAMSMPTKKKEGE